MNEHWTNRFAHFSDAPVVDFVGVVANQGVGAWSPLEQKRAIQPEDIGFTTFTFDVWRVGKGEVQTARLQMMALISYEEVNSLVGFNSSPLRSYSVVRVKAKLARNEAGIQEASFVEWVGPDTGDAELQEARRQLMEPVILELPPLPALRLATSPYHTSWHGTIALSSWDKFHLESQPSHGKSRGPRYPITIESAPPPAVQLGFRGFAPSPEQVAATAYLIENEQAVQDLVLGSILENYREWQQEYMGDDEYMPDVTKAEQLQSLLLLWEVSIPNEAKDGYAYVVLSLLPNWDIEHGIGALLHRDRVVFVGDHDSLGDAWRQERELG
jgi:hypothetical protein